MPSRTAIRYVALASCLLTGETCAAEATTQDMQIIGRALSFKSNGPKRGSMSLAVIFNAGSARSSSEMQAALAALGGGLRVGDGILRAVAVEQGKLGSASGYDGVFTTSDIDQSMLRGVLTRSGVPCFTLDASQVTGGACTVAVRSRPSVAISINTHNAAAAGVSFATAFIMMVREI